MIDHVVYGTPDLAATVAALSARLEVALVPGGAHAGVGTRNHLASLGASVYLELVGPDPEQPEPAEPRPWGIDDLMVPRLLTWCARPARGLGDAVSAGRVAGLALSEPFPMSRTQPDGVVLRWTLSTVEDDRDGGVLPFLIDWGAAPHPTAALPAGLRLRSLHATHPEPARVRAALEALGETLDVRPGTPPRLHATIEGPGGCVALS